MKKIFILFCIVLLSGCMRVRTYTIEKPRTDMEVQGNQGYLSGSSKGVTKKNRFGNSRKISVVEFEFKSKEQETKRYNKKGALKQELFLEEKTLKNEKDEYTLAQDTEYDFLEEVEPLVTEKKEKTKIEKEYKYYTIQKNETLQKVSRKFYNTTTKWKLIFDYNKDILKSPDKIYPGLRIKIPILN
ncbi:MAG: LysM peptidoglycan-binding domain-containing protein [Candidatus Omnitrophica bacterium]|nr:LysM peptidoglycan-binding domain-containing protein [Candidatus Omnitrophota bacterium]